VECNGAAHGWDRAVIYNAHLRPRHSRIQPSTRPEDCVRWRLKIIDRLTGNRVTNALPIFDDAQGHKESR
jgi:hypothetical protein